MAIEYIDVVDGTGAHRKVACDVFNTDEYGQVVKVTFGTDGTLTLVEETVGLPVVGVRYSAPTITRVASSATKVTLKAANAARKALSIFNESTAVLYVRFGDNAAANDYTFQLYPGCYYEMPSGSIYTGLVTGIWAAANGAAQVTEG